VITLLTHVCWRVSNQRQWFRRRWAEMVAMGQVLRLSSRVGHITNRFNLRIVALSMPRFRSIGFMAEVNGFQASLTMAWAER